MMKKRLLLLLSSVLLLIALPSYADIDIVIDKSGDDDSIALLIAPFSGSTHAAKMKEILINDLKRSGRFRFVADHATVEISPLGGRLNPEVLKKTGAGFLIRGGTRSQGGAFTLETEVIDLNSGTKVAGFITSYQPNTRRIAHKTADVIFKHLTGIRGAFDTRVAYVAANGGGSDRIYQLIIADADGYNPKPIVTSVEPIMSVGWSPQADQLVYVSFESGRPAIFIQNLRTGKRKLVSARKGINGAPAWSGDGRTLAISLSIEGNPEIYTLDLVTGRLTRLTHSRAIDTEPSWTANGQHILFTSDRGGTPQLYKIAASGSGNVPPKRMTFTGNYNSDPSVVGEKVALIRRISGKFRVAMMDIASHEADIVSTGSLDESPSLAPNGTMVLYETRGQGRRHLLATVSDNGRERSILHSPYADIGHPAWSPYLGNP
jgi:TolB protein